jgi:hypothetical protein
MNIFYTNENPIICASEHCGIHVNKMIIEYAQMLSTCHFVIDDKMIGVKPTHINHPCNVWLRESDGNYEYVYDLFVNLISIYHSKTRKSHGLSHLCGILKRPPLYIKIVPMTEPPRCMPDEFKVDSVQESYKKYLNFKYKNWTTRTDKKRLSVSWCCDKPKWVNF